MEKNKVNFFNFMSFFLISCEEKKDAYKSGNGKILLEILRKKR